MKKVIVILSSVVALMLLSFAPPQEKKLVRLKNGNYLAQNLKIEQEDAEAIQKQIEELSMLISKEDDRSWKDTEKPKFEDFLTIYESTDGFKAIAAFGAEEQHYAFDEEISSNAIKKLLVYQYESKEADEKKEAFMGQIDDIMGKYLNSN